MRSNRQALWALCVMCSAGVGYGADAPEKVVREYSAALQAEGLLAAPRFMHPDELVRFKEMLMPVIRKESGAEKRPFTEALFGPDMTLADIEKLPAFEFLAALMKMVSGQLQGVEFKPLEIIGSVREKEVVHVVTRTEVAGPQGIRVKRMEVVTVKALNDGWKLMLSGELEGMAAAFSVQ